MRKPSEWTRRERVLVALLAVVVVGVLFWGFGYLYTRVYRPWACTRRAEALLAEYREKPTQETAQRLADVLDAVGGYWARRDEMLRAILRPELLGPDPFRTDERVVIRFRRPSLSFERSRLVEVVECSLGSRHTDSQSTSLGGSARGIGQADLTLLVSRDRSGNQPTIPGHYAMNLHVRYRLSREPEEPLIDRCLYRLRIKTPPMVMVTSQEYRFQIPVEFDVVEPCEAEGEK